MMTYLDGYRHPSKPSIEPNKQLNTTKRQVSRRSSLINLASYSNAKAIKTQVRIGRSAYRKCKTPNPHYYQGALFTLASCAPPLLPSVARLRIEPVSSDLAFAPNRYQFVVTEGDRRWRFPVQFTEQEIKQIFPRLARFDWTLKEGEYFPSRIQEIYEFVESLLDGDLEDWEVAA